MINDKITLETATAEDAVAIRELMVAVENDEYERWFKGGERPFIPGFDSIDMQIYHMWDGRYYKVLLSGEIVAVLLITYTNREHARIDRFYIHPAHQGKGIGTQAFKLLEDMYPQVSHWQLETTRKSARNQHFYKKLGFVLAEEDEEDCFYIKTSNSETPASQMLFKHESLKAQNIRACNMQVLDVYDTNLSDSSFSNCNMEQLLIHNTTLHRTRITNANLNQCIIGDSKMKDVSLSHLSLSGKLQHSDLNGFHIEGCSLEGMTINGILVTDLLNCYKQKGE